MDCYIYYKSKEADAHNIIKAFAQLRSLMSPHLTSNIELQRRPKTTEGQITWMEIYRDIPENFETFLSNAISQCEIVKSISSERHAEYFLPIPLSNN